MFRLINIFSLHFSFTTVTIENRMTEVINNTAPKTTLPIPMSETLVMIC